MSAERTIDDARTDRVLAAVERLGTRMDARMDGLDGRIGEVETKFEERMKSVVGEMAVTRESMRTSILIGAVVIGVVGVLMSAAVMFGG